MNQAQKMYALSLEQIMQAILIGGTERTVLVQGHMGTGKSTILPMLGEELTLHTQCYFDGTTKDLGDVMIPNISVLDDSSKKFVTFATNEELGMHLSKPIILMIDEYGKAPRPVQNALMRLMLERKIGSYTLHEESIVFANTNLAAEGVGDMMLPHQCDRISIITSRKPDNKEWIIWGVQHDIDPIMLSWCKDNPQLFHSFEDVENPEDNLYIFHPKRQSHAFVTPRSLHAASDWMKKRGQLDDQTLCALLMGTIGDRGAMDLMAYVKLADQLPTTEAIKQDPHNARVPDSDAAVCMVVYRALASIERDWVSPWVDYMRRLDAEAQGLFANGVRADGYDKKQFIYQNKKFAQWAMDNGYMFSADKA
jgi:hypothetical protein|tara:strand:- start:2767 stop:3864 length:1098 start_codon:yes stop_codon:yes gene_type:complete